MLEEPPGNLQITDAKVAAALGRVMNVDLPPEYGPARKATPVVASSRLSSCLPDSPQKRTSARISTKGSDTYEQSEPKARGHIRPLFE